MTINVYESIMTGLNEAIEHKNGKGRARVMQMSIEKRIGAAANKIFLPDDFDKNFDGIDDEITEVFENDGWI